MLTTVKAPAVGTADEPTLRDVLKLIRAYATLFICSTAASAVVLFLISFLITPTFQVNMVLSATSTETNPGGGLLSSALGDVGDLASLAGIGLQSRTQGAQEALATLQSHKLAEDLIQDRNLLPILFQSKWDARAKRWKTSNPKKIPTLWDGEEYFTKYVRRASDDRKTGLITLVVEWSDPNLAAQWAQDLVSRTNALMKTRAVERSRRHLLYLQEQLAKTTVVGLQEAIYRLTENEMKDLMVTEGTDEYAFKIIDPAIVPGRKSWPNRVLFASIGAVFGLLASLTYVLLSDSSRKV